MTRRLASLVGMVSAVCLLVAGSVAPARAVELDPKAVVFKLPDKIEWKKNATGGAEQAVLAGDPSKPGLYVVLTKWLPGNMSRPHWHPNDRFITVISGTWWVGSGDKFDPEATVPVREGSFAVHEPKEVHYDGAKDEEVIVQIVGVGPSGTIVVEPKK